MHDNTKLTAYCLDTNTRATGYGRVMASDEHDTDPFSSESLWRLSKFSIDALQPLTALPWNEELPSMRAA